MKIAVQRDDFDIGTEVKSISGKNRKIGAIAGFIGLVRDVNGGTEVGKLTIEHYPGMTEKALAAIVEEAKGRWEVLDCTVIHRFGELKPTDQIVLVVVASGHRGDAFAACEFIMDYLKTQAPFWKKEQTPEGARWVEARRSDEDAADLWTADDKAAERRR